VRSASSSAGLLVISEQFDDGWHAQIDGRDAPVVKVDGFMLGVRVPAGLHTLELTYTAPGLHVGMAVSFVALLLVIALLVDRRARGSGRSGPQARAEAGTDADAGRSRSEPVVAAPGPATLGVHRRRPRLLNQRA
jgi:hypothetical protein